MNIKKLECSLLPALHTLLKAKSVTKAAYALNISQSAMSKVFAQLRDSFSDELLIRTGKKYVLSHRAECLLTELELLLPMIEQLWIPKELNLQAEERLLNIAGTDMDITYIAKQLDMIMSQAPKSVLSISASHELSLNDLKQGKLDFLITAFKDAKGPLESANLMTSEYVVVTNKDFTLNSMSLDTYLASEHVAFQLSNEQKSAMGIELARQSLKRNTVLWTANFHQAISSVVNSKRNLKLTLPRKFVESSELVEQLNIFPLPFEKPKFELFLYWHKKSNTDPFLSWVRERILS